MAMDHSYGLMDQNTKAIGVEIRPTVRESLSMLMEIYMKGNG
jgi:hypothetical protein